MLPHLWRNILMTTIHSKSMNITNTTSTMLGLLVLWRGKLSGLTTYQERNLVKTLKVSLATWGVKFYEWTLEAFLFHIVESVIASPHHQLILGEGEEVLQDAGGGYWIINWLHYVVTGKVNSCIRMWREQIEFCPAIGKIKYLNRLRFSWYSVFIIVLF